MNVSRELYDDRYRQGYRQQLDDYEYARHHALDHFMGQVVPLCRAGRFLDYGAGNGLFLPLWEALLPQGELHFCDISPVALAQLAQRHPAHGARCHLVTAAGAEAADEHFDTVVSVEVMEHVADLDAYLRDIYRLLRPGGWFVWTTPCANFGSLEYLHARYSGVIEQTAEGYCRFAWEDPTHLRRLTSAQAKARLRQVGFTRFHFRFRAHLFSHLLGRYWRLADLPAGRKRPWYLADYRYFRRFPNGASMLGAARKPL